MAGCVRTCRDCSELCWICSVYMARGTVLAASVCLARVKACDLCAAKCGKHQADSGPEAVGARWRRFSIWFV